MTRTRALWRLVFLSYPCPSCGAEPGEDCTTSGGQVAAMVHVARTRDAGRCPRCGTQVDSTAADPGTYCARCQRLRELEIERVTTHRRLT